MTKMSSVTIFFTSDRANPAYYLYNGSYYNYRGSPVTQLLRFRDPGSPAFIPSKPDLTGYDSSVVSLPIKYSPIVVSVPQATALYVNGQQKVNTSGPKSWNGYTNWYVKLPIPIEITGGGKPTEIRFTPGTIDPQLAPGLSSLSPYPNIGLKAVAGIPVFYNVGSPIEEQKGNLVFNHRYLSINGHPLNATVLRQNYPNAQYIYLDDTQLVIFGSDSQITPLRIQSTGALTLPKSATVQTPLSMFTGSQSKPTDNTEYQNLNRDVLVPLLQKGTQTGVGYDLRQRALNILKTITDQQTQLQKIEQTYRELQASLQKNIQDYTSLKNQLGS